MTILYRNFIKLILEHEEYNMYFIHYHTIHTCAKNNIDRNANRKYLQTFTIAYFCMTICNTSLIVVYIAIETYCMSTYFSCSSSVFVIIMFDTTTGKVKFIIFLHIYICINYIVSLKLNIIKKTMCNSRILFFK